MDKPEVKDSLTSPLKASEWRETSPVRTVQLEFAQWKPDLPTVGEAAARRVTLSKGKNLVNSKN